MRFIGALLLVLLQSVGLVNAQDQDTEALLNDIVSEFAEEDGPAVVVQLTTPDGTWTVTSGIATEDRPTAAKDRFRIGSMSKTFVAVAALMLAEDQVFSLDDPAADWLPEDILDNIANTEIVTIRQLLGMRSGIEDYLTIPSFWEAVDANPSYAWTAPEVLEFVHGVPAVSAPDEEFAYSNTNYVLLQLVLEAASGMPLHELLRERILDPLSMDDTYTQIQETLPGGFVQGYGDLDGNGELENLTEINDGAGLGDGGLISNAADLTTFYHALLQEQSLLSPGMMEELLAFQTTDEVGGYSLGLNVWNTPQGEAWGHAGGVLGFLSIGAYLPKEDITLIVLSASANFAPEELALAVIDGVLD